MVAAAIAGGALIGAVGSTVAGGEAAGATSAASSGAINEQEWALQQQQAQEAPYTTLGQQATPQLANLLGIGGQGAAGEEAALASTPGYQFTKQQGNQGTLNAASSTGMALSGNTLQALDKYNSGLADSTYQQAVGNAENAVNTGQAAASGQAANIGNAASNISSNLINQGNTLAGIDTNVAAGISGAATSAANQYATYNTLQNLTSASGGGYNGVSPSTPYPTDPGIMAT